MEFKQAFITPSNFSKLMAVKGLGKVAQDYADELVLSMVGIWKPFFTSAPTNWGIEKEQEAIDRYSLETLQTAIKVEESIPHPFVPYIKGKPDAIIQEISGIIEVKCPYNPNGHLDTMRDWIPELTEMPKGKYLEDYWWQIQGYLWITETEFCDFVSYDPRYPVEQQLLKQRIYPNDKDIKLLADRCEEFWGLVQSRIPEKLKM